MTSNFYELSDHSKTTLLKHVRQEPREREGLIIESSSEPSPRATEMCKSCRTNRRPELERCASSSPTDSSRALRSTQPQFICHCLSLRILLLYMKPSFKKWSLMLAQELFGESKRWCGETVSKVNWTTLFKSSFTLLPASSYKQTNQTLLFLLSATV